MVPKSIWSAIKRRKYHPRKACKSRQMQFHNLIFACFRHLLVFPASGKFAPPAQEIWDWDFGASLSLRSFAIMESNSQIPTLCLLYLCENFTSLQRARVESNLPNTRFKEHRLQSSVKTVQLWTIQQALGKTRFQASADSQENTPDSNPANKCFPLWPKDQIALNCYQTQALRTTGSKQV